jgi:phage-related protein (TIGR01555 family)
MKSSRRRSEILFYELRKRDDASANISFLIFMANIRVQKVEDLAQAITIGDQEALSKMYATISQINRSMCNTGTYLIDKESDFDTRQFTFTGLNDIYESFMLDIAGASEIPVDKLFGRSPAGFNNGESTLQNYYDSIQEKQETTLRNPLEKIMKIIAASAIGEIPDDMEIVYSPVRRPSDLEKSDLAQKSAQPLFDAFDRGIIKRALVLKELKQQQKLTGLWTNITDDMIAKAEEEDEEDKQREKEMQEAMLNGNQDNEETDDLSEEDDKKEKVGKSDKKLGIFNKKK